MSQEGKVTIYRPDDCYDLMKHGLLEGKVKGTTTHNKDLDQCWRWRKKEANIWTGYANEGKSLFLKQLCGAKALYDDWRFAFSAPEDFPAEEFFDDLIHTVAGLTTDRDYTDVISEELYDRAFDLIRDKFVFVYVKPPNNTIEMVLKEFSTLCGDEHIDACIIDPLLKFARPRDMSDRDDIYASYIGSLATDFCRETNTSFHLVMHQLTPTFEDVGANKRYAEPSMYRVKGGGSWADGFDNVLSIWRPKYAFDKLDTEVQFSSQKIKKQKLVGIPQRFKMRFDRKSNRYKEANSGKDIFNFDKIMYGSED